MDNNIKIIYNYKYGAFIIPKEVLHYLDIDFNGGFDVKWNDPIRTNSKLIEFMEQYKVHNGKSAQYNFLSKIFNTNKETLLQINSHLDKIDIKEIPRYAYDNGAIYFSEYDGKESIEINNDKLLLVKVRSLLSKLSNVHISNEINREVSDLVEEFNSFCL